MKSVTEIVHFFPECFVFGINTRELQMHSAAVLCLAHALGAGSYPLAATATGEGVMPLPSSQQH